MYSAPVIIAVYFICWALIHSALASLTVKRWARKLFGPSVARWYRLAFVGVAGFSLLPLLWLLLLLPDIRLYHVLAPWSWIMQGVRGLALLALGWATFQAGVMHFLGVAQLFSATPDEMGYLQVHGFFRYVRHPLYLFSTLFLWLSPTMTVNTAVLYGLIVLYFVIGSLHEEQLLLAEFGKAYQTYREQVPCFIPWPGRHYRDQ